MVFPTWPLPNPGPIGPIILPDPEGKDPVLRAASKIVDILSKGDKGENNEEEE